MLLNCKIAFKGNGNLGCWGCNSLIFCKFFGYLGPQNVSVVPFIILEKWFPLQGERPRSLYFWSFQQQNREEGGTEQQTYQFTQCYNILHRLQVHHLIILKRCTLYVAIVLSLHSLQTEVEIIATNPSKRSLCLW